MATSDTSDEVPPGLRAAARRGFPISRPAGEIVNARERVAIVRVRRLRALTAIIDLQQYLNDDDRWVRRSARSAIEHSLHAAYLAALPVQMRITHPQLRWIDRVLGRFLRKQHDQDRLESPLFAPHAARRVRGAFIGVVLLCAMSAAASYMSGRFAIGAVLVVAMMGFDIVEGAFAREANIRSAGMRWTSCIASQAADVTVMMGAALVVSQTTPNIVVLFLAGVLLSVFGSLVRTSALQAGHWFFRSYGERVLRLVALVTFGIIAYWSVAVASLLTASLLAVCGILECVRTITRVATHPVEQGGFLFLKSDGRAECWGFELDDVPTDSVVELEDVPTVLVRR